MKIYFAKLETKDLFNLLQFNFHKKIKQKQHFMKMCGKTVIFIKNNYLVLPNHNKEKKWVKIVRLVKNGLTTQKWHIIKMHF